MMRNGKRIEGLCEATIRIRNTSLKAKALVRLSVSVLLKIQLMPDT